MTGSGLPPLMLKETAAARVTANPPSTLTTADLLSLVARVDATKTSALLQRFDGSLRSMRREFTSLTAARLTPSQAGRVVAALELGHRLEVENRPSEGAPIRCPRDAVEYCRSSLEDLPVEEFHILVLDCQHRLVRNVLVTRGLLNSSLVHPREVFAEAIRYRAATIIAVHNHPSGDPTPSRDDRVVTDQLVQAGRILDIRLQDHIVIGSGGRYTSFAEAGLL